jgi:N-acetyl-gamma-glutamyl-phosphate reductase
MSDASKKIRAGVAGAAGYTGGETIRLLIHHPNVELVFANSQSQAGKLISDVHGDILGDTALRFTDGLNGDIDVLFLCMGHGESRRFLEHNAMSADVRIVDLSQDFRLNDSSQFGGRSFVYGLPELNHSAITETRSIANPGCFATALQLGLLPLAKAGMLKSVYSTGITGSTGAGQGLSATSHFSWRANNIQPYKTLQHQHMAELMQSLKQLQSDAGDVHFVPWRGDFTRGIFVSSTVDCSLSQEEVMSLYKDFYTDAAFTIVSPKMIDLKQVVNTNKCLIFPEKVGEKLVVHSAIDNLLKGAAGQAVQNMNLMFGLDERTGLQLKAGYF